MPKQKYGDPISQSEAKQMRYHLTSVCHVKIPPNWSAWNKTPQQLADDVFKFTDGEITFTQDEIELILGRVIDLP